MYKPVKKILRDLLINCNPPGHISRNYRDIPGLLDQAELDQIDAGDTYSGRVEIARHYMIPWLDRARSLSGCRVLEIGCGMGASTVAIAEQGCHVTAVDISQESLQFAEERCKSLGLPVDFLVANATEVSRLLSGQKFDFIIFYASLEHMTHEERISSMRETWGMLNKGDFWCIAGTPNRLWPYDYHTAYLPFYYWLSDDLAFAYSNRSGRSGFHELYKEPTPDNMLHFLRRGRGLSYHEFDLAFGSISELDVVSCMGIEWQQLRWFNKWRSRFTAEHHCESFLNRFAPHIHRGFFRKSLDLIIRK